MKFGMMSTKRKNDMGHERTIYYNEMDIIRLHETCKYTPKLLNGDILRIISCLKFFFESSNEFIFTGSNMILYEDNTWWSFSGYRYSNDRYYTNRLNYEFKRLFPTSQSLYNVLWFVEYLIYNEIYSISMDVDDLIELKNVYHSIIDGLGDISTEDIKSVISKINIENRKHAMDVDF